MTTNAVVAIDVGGTNLRTGAVDPFLDVFGFTIEKSRPILEVEAPLDALETHLESYCEAQLHGEKPAAVAIGFPGTVDRERRRLLSTSNLAFLQNLPVVDALEDRLQVPVYIDKDVNLLLRYDIRDQGLNDVEAVVGCYIGTGLGNAFALSGHVYIGAHGAAGELGHIPVIGGQDVCGCGNIGCIEPITSGLALERLAEVEFPGTRISRLFVEHPGDPRLEAFVNNLAVPIAAEVNILDPNVVILGGGLVSMQGFPMKILTDAVFRMSRKPFPAEALEFRLSRPSQVNGVVGGAIMAFENLAVDVLCGKSGECNENRLWI